VSKMSRRIVVDASVARSAGGTSHPDSTLCREFLLAMLKIWLASLLGDSPDLVGRRLDAVKKDCLLVDAALACDGLIASRDDEMRAILRTVARDIEQLRKLVWVNPTTDSETTVRWLGSGARNEPARQLGNS
jgi:hypothetical protein